MSAALAWIAARFGRALAPVVTGFVFVGAILLAVMGMKKSAYKKGKEQEHSENERANLRRAIAEGEDYAEISKDMHEAQLDGPRSRADVIDRLSSATDD